MPPRVSFNINPAPSALFLPSLADLMQLCQRHLTTKNPADKALLKARLEHLLANGILESLETYNCYPQANAGQLIFAASYLTLFKYAQIRIDRRLEHLITLHPNWREVSWAHEATNQIFNHLSTAFITLHFPVSIHFEDRERLSIDQLGTLLTITINNKISVLFNIENDNPIHFNVRQHVLERDENIHTVRATATNQELIATFIHFKCVLLILSEIYGEAYIDLMKLPFEEFCTFHQESSLVYLTLSYYVGVKSFLDAVNRLVMHKNAYPSLATHYQQLEVACLAIKQIVDAPDFATNNFPQYLITVNPMYSLALSLYGHIVAIQNPLVQQPRFPSFLNYLNNGRTQHNNGLYIPAPPKMPYPGGEFT